MSRRLPPPPPPLGVEHVAMNQVSKPSGGMLERLEPPPRHPTIKPSTRGTSEKPVLPPPTHPTSPFTLSSHLQPPSEGRDPTLQAETSSADTTSSLPSSDETNFEMVDSAPLHSVQSLENATTETGDLVPGSLHSGSETAEGDEILRLDAKAFSLRLEDEAIERYLIDFKKHVHHLRVNVPSTEPVAILPRPLAQDYTFSAITRRKAVNEAIVKGSDVVDIPGNIEALGKSEMREEPEKPVKLDELGQPGDPIPVEKDEAWTWMDIDWVAYSSAYLRYLLGPPAPLPPLEPFTVARLRSNAERLYVVARPPWEAFGSAVGAICLWKNKVHTGIIVLVRRFARTALITQIYTLLVISSLLLPALFLLPLYPLLKRRFFPPSPMSQYMALLEERKRVEEASELVEEVVDDQSSVVEGVHSFSGMGFKVDLNKAKDGLGLGGLEGVQEMLGEEDGEQKNGGKQAKKEKKKLKAMMRKLEEEVGAGAVVVLGDLADLHEKIKNLYLWRSPSTSKVFACILATLSLASYLTPLWVLVKLVEIAIGVVAFVVVPLIAAQERYEPMSWMAGNAPTDADCMYPFSFPCASRLTYLSTIDALRLLRERALTGEPLVIPKSKKMGSQPSLASLSSSRSLVPSTTSRSLALVPEETRKTDWEKMKTFGKKSARLIETSRQIAAGEREFKFGFSPPTQDAEQPLGAGVKSITHLRLGKDGPGLMISEHAPPVEETEETVSYFAQFGSTTGNLLISSSRVAFKPLLPASKGRAEKDKESGIPKERSVDLDMNDVIGIRKRDKVSLLVVVASGLEIECVGGKLISFALVANRDQAFHRLVALSNKNFIKV
ncbi:hypothetical protein P7C73_g27, partial [Tremellales sp. Uapishka_1]